MNNSVSKETLYWPSPPNPQEPVYTVEVTKDDIELQIMNVPERHMFIFDFKDKATFKSLAAAGMKTEYRFCDQLLTRSGASDLELWKPK